MQQLSDRSHPVAEMDENDLIIDEQGEDGQGGVVGDSMVGVGGVEGGPPRWADDARPVGVVGQVDCALEEGAVEEEEEEEGESEGEVGVLWPVHGW